MKICLHFKPDCTSPEGFNLVFCFGAKKDYCDERYFAIEFLGRSELREEGQPAALRKDLD